MLEFRHLSSPLEADRLAAKGLREVEKRSGWSTGWSTRERDTWRIPIEKGVGES